MATSSFSSTFSPASVPVGLGHESERVAGSLFEEELLGLEASFNSNSEMISYILNGWITLFFVVTGIVLNVLCIYVFLKFRQGSAAPVIQYYLVTLTAWQTALLCNAFLLYCLPTLLYGHVISFGEYVHLYPAAYALANTTYTATIWVVVTLTVDRYLALCRPLSHRAIGKRSRVKRMMVLISLLAIIFSLPRFFEVTTVYYCEGDECTPSVSRTSLTENSTYWSIYHIVLPIFLVTLCPCLLLCILTLRISLALHRASTKRRALCAPKNELDARNKDATRSKKEHKANIMLVLVIAKFLVSDILPTVVDVLEHLVGNSVFQSSALATVFVDFSNLLLVVNGSTNFWPYVKLRGPNGISTNFWVYLLFGKRFRRSCLYLFSTSSGGRSFIKLMRLTVDSGFARYLTPQPTSLTTNNYFTTRSKAGGCSDVYNEIGGGDGSGGGSSGGDTNKRHVPAGGGGREFTSATYLLSISSTTTTTPKYSRDSSAGGYRAVAAAEGAYYRTNGHAPPIKRSTARSSAQALIFDREEMGTESRRERRAPSVDSNGQRMMRTTAVENCHLKLNPPSRSQRASSCVPGVGTAWDIDGNGASGSASGLQPPPFK